MQTFAYIVGFLTAIIFPLLPFLVNYRSIPKFLDNLTNELRDFIYETENTTPYKDQIQIKAYIVATFLSFVGIFTIFRVSYIILLHQYRTGLIQISLDNTFVSITSKFISTSAIFLFGYILFKFKKHYQALYGLTETAFSLASTYTIVDNVQRTLFEGKAAILAFIPLMTTLYLIVRGISNFSDGLAKIKPPGNR